MLRLGLLCALTLAWPASKAASFDFWYAHTGGPIADAIKSLCDGFNASQRRHRVRCTSPGTYEQTMQKTIAAYRAGKQPAVVEIYDVGTLDMMLSGAVYPVFQLMQEANQADDPVDWQDYIDAVRSYYATSAGNLYSLPFNISTAALYTNTAQLAAAGVTTAPQTWEAFQAAAEKLKAAGQSCPAVSDYNPWIMLEQIAAVQGAPLATQNNGHGGLNAKYVFNTGMPLRFMEDVMRWRQQRLLIDAAATRTGSQTLAFANGECAMAIDATSAWSAIRTSGIANVGVSPIPAYAGTLRRNSVPGGASLWVMKGYDTQVYAAVAAFFSYLRQPSSQIAFARRTGYVPVTREAVRVLQQNGAADSLAPALVGISSMSLPGNAYSPGARLGFSTQFRHAWREEVENAFAGRQSMKSALDRAKSRGDILLRRFEETYAGATLP
ncbi:extracellular solute-binding protein [Collimonas sp.]|jgi:sn-glycerol 3-phosphate transport system substrate-binding protein|uniref:extracellular solute-binding protein n=1 Tax=Collimonas sp. TaxID=1963772 RepID=UPI002CC932C5|nr:extracellular solute-binding protein [Collimonas sp.]HWW07319.1 extracellular solute-binding protein [Collimonas sp.]